ncbi:unnamed protein product [Cunninghamella echinulata]
MSTYMTTSTACYEPISNYQTAFPALQALPLPYPLQQSQTSRKRRTSTVSTLQQSLTPPKPPAYLKHTQYADLVREQYQYKLHKRYDCNSSSLLTTKNGNDAISITSSSNKHKRQQHDQVQIMLEDNNILNELDLRLPSFWSTVDKSNYLDIDKNGLEVKYIGPGKQEEHAGTVRSNFPMRPQCGIYYFEIFVKSKGDDGYIGIGFCSEKNKLNRLPGWDELSFGYHGDDGNSFKSSGTGTEYGPQFGTGDTVGCCVNFANQTAFFTKNGAFLGTAFTNLDFSITYYPCVGMQTAGECITVNFGQEPFVYDITQYIKEQKLSVWKGIQSYNLTQNNLIQPKYKITKKKFINENKNNNYNNTNNIINQLIHSYLMHHGYTSTANALHKDINYITTKSTKETPSDCSMNNTSMELADEGKFYQRIDIKSSIDHGNIDQAVELIQFYFPKLLNGNGNDTYINFRLKCQKFVEMIREHSKNEQRRRSSIKSITTNKNNTDSHQHIVNEVENITTIGSEEDNHRHHQQQHPLSSSHSSSNISYFDNMNDHHNDLPPQSNSKQQQFIHPLTSHLADNHENDDGKSILYPSNLSNNNCISINTHSLPISNHNNNHSSIDHHHYLNNNKSKPFHILSHHVPPNTYPLTSPAQGKRKSWAEIAASPSTINHQQPMEGVIESNNTSTSLLICKPSTTTSTTRRRSSFRRGSCCSNSSNSVYSNISGSLTNHDLILDEEGESIFMKEKEKDGNNDGEDQDEDEESSDDMMTMTDDGSSITSIQSMQSIMDYGQQLRDTYGKEQNPLYKEKLKQIFSLLAYPDPYSSSVGHLLDVSNREELSSYINSAILVCQNQPESPSLDRIYRQIITINKELTFAGHGESTLLDFSRNQDIL